MQQANSGSLEAPVPIATHRFANPQLHGARQVEEADMQQTQDVERLQYQLQFSSLIYDITESQNRTIEILIKLAQLKNKQDTPSSAKGPATSPAISMNILQSKSS